MASQTSEVCSLRRSYVRRITPGSHYVLLNFPVDRCPSPQYKRHTRAFVPLFNRWLLLSQLPKTCVQITQQNQPVGKSGPLQNTHPSRNTHKTYLLAAYNAESHLHHTLLHR